MNIRTTKPSAGNKFFNTKSNGGYSTCIQGSPTDKECNVLANCVGYEKEMEFIIANAQKNEKGGLNADKVVKTILKADNSQNPKLSYTVGRDAFCASVVAKLPQSIINFLVKFGLKMRLK